MHGAELHRDLTVFDGLIVSNFSRAVFEDMRRGGLTAANCTCCIWEGFEATMANVGRWKHWFSENADLITQVHTTADIARAKKEGKTGIALGWQNLTGIEDQIAHLALFKQLGVGIMQIAYNTQNLVGTGCYESKDGGLSDFGHEVIAEMNRLGILCDLSHVGPKTSEDVIKASKKPCAYTHCAPAALKSHPRNKSDEQLRFIVDKGGFVGVTMFPPFLKRGTSATVDDYVEAMEHVIGVCGEDQVGLRHRLHPGLRARVLRVDYARQGLRAQAHRVRRHHQPRRHARDQGLSQSHARRWRSAAGRKAASAR